jgi:uncharacterized oxidoreductase
VVAGAGCACTGDEPGNGFVILVLDVSRFQPLDAFKARIDEVIDAVASVPPAPGFSRVVVPGEPEIATEAQRELSGIPISEETWRQFKEAARSVGVEIDGDEGETGQGRWVD